MRSIGIALARAGLPLGPNIHEHIPTHKMLGQYWWMVRKAKKSKRKTLYLGLADEPLHVDLPGVSRPTAAKNSEPMHALSTTHIVPNDSWHWSEPLKVQVPGWATPLKVQVQGSPRPSGNPKGGHQ